MSIERQIAEETLAALAAARAGTPLRPEEIASPEVRAALASKNQESDNWWD